MFLKKFNRIKGKALAFWKIVPVCGQVKMESNDFKGNFNRIRRVHTHTHTPFRLTMSQPNKNK